MAVPVTSVLQTIYLMLWNTPQSEYYASMTTLLNTLYVTTQRTYLSLEGETILIRLDRKTLAKLPIHILDGVVCMGNVTVSPFLMGKLGQTRTSLSFLTERGRFLARVVGPVSGNVVLRCDQVRICDDVTCSLAIARGMIVAKALNARQILLRARRQTEVPAVQDALATAIRELKTAASQASSSHTLEHLRGIEGYAAKVYFAHLQFCVRSKNKLFDFKKRTRRPPRDAVNAVLSFVYTLICHDVASALETVGLDPQIGFLHRERPGRPSLALDLMEEFRSYIGERLVLALINRNQLGHRDFENVDVATVYLSESGRKTVLAEYQTRKKKVIEHPFLNEKVQVGLLPFVQAKLLARTIRGEYDAYPAFIWR